MCTVVEWCVKIFLSMGSLLSVGSPDTNLYEDIYTTHPAIGKRQYEFSSLNLSEENIGKLYTKFSFLISSSAHNETKTKTTGEEIIEIKELFHHYSLSKSRFASRVFQFYDLEETGKCEGGCWGRLKRWGREGENFMTYLSYFPWQGNLISMNLF